MSKNSKNRDLEKFRVDAIDAPLTTNQGVKISDNQNTLKASVRGPSLLEDFIFREKITHFDHERIPERAVHARGAGAHGYFQVYESQSKLTKAAFLQNPSERTPVFVRFSTVAGSRGSADTVRDVRGFAVKFYTTEGNFDLVGNNIPVFFIQDAIKFPDLIHAAKPEPDSEMPQAATAHDTFWDFVSVMPESMHMIMWAMSDRAIPRSFRMMEGFGVHTFRLINARGKSHFVKFHWKPILGLHSLVWEEAQQLAGKDADFHRRDLWEAIEQGNFPEWELGLQVVKEDDEHAFDFDLLDPTKIIPEEIVPVQRIGKLTLNKNPDNFFAETEQVAFHPGHIVPGIDFTNDPLLQGRLFSYLDTQLSRLGGPNFHQIPINRAVCPFFNNQRDGMHQQSVFLGKVAYQPNSLANDMPSEQSVRAGGFSSYPEKISGEKIRMRSISFADHYSQATLFYNSQSIYEKRHLSSALQFELAKVESAVVKKNVIAMLLNINKDLAKEVATGLGISLPKPMAKAANVKLKLKSSAALSMANTNKNSIKTRKIALLVYPGCDTKLMNKISQQLTDAGAIVKKVGKFSKVFMQLDHTIQTMPSIMFDAVIMCGNAKYFKTIVDDSDARVFVTDAFGHFKTFGVIGDQKNFKNLFKIKYSDGIIFGKTNSVNVFVKEFISALKQHRHWERKI